MTATFPLPDDPGGPVRPAERGPLPARALETSAEHPWPVRLLARKIEQYVERMAPVWVEGQVVQLNRRPGTSTAFLTLRDTDLDMSLPVSAATRVLRGATLEEGAHVVVHAKPVYWTRRGQLQLQAREIRPVGVGELLARIEHLKRVLAAEGLFDAERKRPLPFLPKVVGLVCGRESKAEHDVVVNARARWPRVRFEIREVAVQGAHAVQQVSDAIRALDADPDVEVIVVARGGGAVEDLLPFSNEALVRVAAACRTPLVSAIGHETDSPLLDLVADVRASTPTAAAKRVVPDVAEERARVAQSRQRLRAAIAGTVAREQAGLDAVRSRPVLAAPHGMLADRAERVGALRDRARRALDARLVRAAGDVGRLEAQVRALSPASTLERGYAVVQRADGHVVRSPADVAADDAVRVRLAHGSLDATVTALHDADAPAPGPVGETS
ncbi:exodeoxyribonuclease VII large subunit [Cellulosimicrobium sp. BIT-GX5]|uniref:Exodeoxyribonuclease 7 large subunit n=1 Tax=Cellulosimicrobium composti TaxID=2672572 RepID=A0A6N7ZHL1_9MICO|nr:exodeoxyribonuclease VII large subunit [Cellulosimicrobium composti]MTG88906.1 exodeoxyribonuclease VII large subunit [Cellulosimicrobium composti]